jgi:hypothetical protein
MPIAWHNLKEKKDLLSLAFSLSFPSYFILHALNDPFFQEEALKQVCFGYLVFRIVDIVVIMAFVFVVFSIKVKPEQTWVLISMFI